MLFIVLEAMLGTIAPHLSVGERRMEARGRRTAFHG